MKFKKYSEGSIGLKSDENIPFIGLPPSVLGFFQLRSIELGPTLSTARPPGAPAFTKQSQILRFQIHVKIRCMTIFNYLYKQKTK